MTANILQEKSEYNRIQFAFNHAWITDYHWQILDGVTVKTIMESILTSELSLRINKRQQNSQKKQKGYFVKQILLNSLIAVLSYLGSKSPGRTNGLTQSERKHGRDLDFRHLGY